jgi:hypothetical protein
VAVRVLQKALGVRGLPMWAASPHRAWVEAFPQGKSFVRRLAEKHVYACPVFGGDLRGLIRQGEQALGQAFYRQGNFEESANVFNKLLSEAAPTLPVLRGLGLALTRLGKHDQAFKHLRTAVEMDPQHGLTAGYLALCGAKGKPAQPEDRPKNVQWAVKQVSRFDGTGNPEYAAIMSAIHAEARSIHLEVARADQMRVCQVLASVRRTTWRRQGRICNWRNSIPTMFRTSTPGCSAGRPSRRTRAARGNSICSRGSFASGRQRNSSSLSRSGTWTRSSNCIWNDSRSDNQADSLPCLGRTIPNRARPCC